MKKLSTIACLLPFALVACTEGESGPSATADTGTIDTGIPSTDGGGETATDTPAPNPRAVACAKVLEAKKAKYTSDLAAWSSADLPKMLETSATASDGSVVGPEHTAFAGRYRDDLTKHPGCKPRTAYDGKLFLNATNEATVVPGVPVQGADKTAPGYVPGYACAAKEYTMPSGVSVDGKKPIVILVHGNSANPNSWEEFSNSKMTDQDTATPGLQLKNVSKFTFTADAAVREQLAAKLVKKGFRVIALDMRTDATLTLAGVNLKAGATDPGFGDALGNVDHGWSVPLLQSLLKAVMEANPDAKIALVGHSLGYTVIQDALRRMHNDRVAGKLTFNPFSRIKGVVLASGAAHGVASGTFNCTTYKTMRGSVNCEMGDRATYTPTAFNKINNGPGDMFAVPCADGSFAYGKADQCGGNVIDYTTITMKDPVGGALQDEFVSVASSRIDMDQTTVKSDGSISVTDPACVDNHLIELTDYDTSGYFLDGAPGFLANHFGSIRSEAAMTFIVGKLGG